MPSVRQEAVLTLEVLKPQPLLPEHRPPPVPEGTLRHVDHLPHARVVRQQAAGLLFDVVVAE